MVKGEGFWARLSNIESRLRKLFAHLVRQAEKKVLQAELWGCCSSDRNHRGAAAQPPSCVWDIRASSPGRNISYG